MNISLDNEQNNKYTCDCGKKYKERSGLWRHHKVCNKLKKDNTKIILHIPLNNIEYLTNLVTDIITQNKEMQKQLTMIINK